MMRLSGVILRLSAAAIALGACLPIANAADRYYVVRIDGAKAGWARESETEKDGVITSSSEMNFRITRMGQAVTMELATSFVETAAGDPISMSSRQMLGGAGIEESYRFIAGIDTYEVTRQTTTAGGVVRKTEPWPEGPWKPQAAARRAVAAALARGEKQIESTTLDPGIGLKPVTLRFDVEGPTEVEVMGKVVPAIAWRVTNSALPGVLSKDFVDQQAELLRTEIDLGGIKLVMLASEKEVALSPADAPELMAQTLVTPKDGRRIERPRETTKASFVLSLGGEGQMPDVPDGGSQRVERLPDGRLRVRVDLGPAPVLDEQQRARASHADCAGPTTMVQSDDQAIRVLARTALEGARPGASVRERAELMRVAASKHIEGASLGVGFASAADVVRTRRGDCSEYAVLLAALLRAQDIPSRLISGVVYVPEFEGRRELFGYHMWTQALVHEDDGPRWIDLDAALSSARAFDATHIALAASCMGEAEVVNSLAGLVSVLGRLEIEIESVSYEPLQRHAP